VKQLGLDPRKLVFIDETWAKTNMTRLRGRASQGERLIAALGDQGMRCSTTVDGAINADVFESFVEQVLIQSLSAGDIVVMDNLSSHKRARVRQRVESVGATALYLPPYSPDLNPIEMAFAKLKQRMRWAGHRTMNALWQDVQRRLDQITTSDATGFFRHCGDVLQVK
jgi:transposase